MNVEETQRVKRLAEEKQQEEKQRADTATLEKKQEALNFLKTRRIFKDLLDGREDLFKQCKEYLLLNVLLPQVGANELTDAHFCAGYRIALETFEAVMSAYKEYEKKYNE